MPRLAATIRTVPTNEPLIANIIDGSGRSAIDFGTGLFQRLVRFAAAANEDRAGAAGVRDARPSPPNRCEFDYDYYVPLQSRRRTAPSRSNPSATARRAV